MRMSWQQISIGTLCLWPFSCLYRGVVALRRWAYRSGWKRVHHFPVPVIVVGNISVGGTGKTPCVIALAQRLVQAGYHPGIVSRGYGGRAPVYPVQVTAQTSTDIAGDEAVLITRRTGCPVVVAPNRPAATERLLAEYGCDVVLSDDGLQHYALGRDIEIALVDQRVGHGNGLLLPAGPLREPLSRLASVDYCLTHQKKPDPSRPVMTLKMASRVLQVADPTQSLSLEDVRAQPWVALAGIGTPDRFFAAVRDQGVSLDAAHSLPDHHRLNPKEVRAWRDAWVLMTEKDAVKCADVAGPHWFYWPVEAEITPAYLDDWIAEVAQLVRQKARA